MDNYFEQIQGYLDGTLSTREHQRFEAELKTNAELQRETGHQRMLRETITKHMEAESRAAALKETLQRTGGEYFGNKARSTGKTVVRWMVAAMAAACLLIVGNFMGWFAPSYDTLPEMPLLTSRSHGQDSIYSEAAEAFNAGDYPMSTELLRSIFDQDTAMVRNRHYLGLSLVGERKYSEALDALQPVADGNSLFASEASYFMAVILSELGRDGEAMHYAERVSVDSEYRKKAKRLLRNLARE